MNLHVRLANGTTHNFDVEDVNNVQDALSAAANCLDVPIAQLKGYEVDFNGDDIVVSPPAIPGK